MKRRTNRLEELRKGQAEAAEKRRQLMEQLKQPSTKKSPKPEPPTEQSEEIAPNRFAAVDTERAIAATEQLSFMTFDIEVSPAKKLNRPTLELLEAFLETLKGQESTAILQWPFGQRDVSFLHPLAMLALLSSTERNTVNNLNLCEEAPGLRTLYFPWRGGATSAVQKSLLVRRDEIIEFNKYHLTRQHASETKELSPIDMLHLTLGHLGQLAQRDASKPHLAHPTLAELYPTFVAEGGDPPPQAFKSAIGELFGRVRHGANLDRMTDYRPVLSSPKKAPFGFYGVSPLASLRRALGSRVFFGGNAGASLPDICILDLGTPALSRLGPNWNELVEEFVAEAKKRFPTMPFFVVTQDTFVHRRLASLLRTTTKSKGIRSNVILRLTRDPFADDPFIGKVSSISASFSTVAGPTADAIAALSDAARGSSDPALAGTLRREMGSLRKAASLPCGLTRAYDFLCDELGQSATETFLEYKSRGTLLAPLEDALNSEIGGNERDRILRARDAVKRAFDTLDVETPIGSLFSDLAATLARKSSRTIIAFASDIDRSLGEMRLVGDPETGAGLGRSMEKGHLKLESKDDLEAGLAEIEGQRDRNSWKRLVMIAPTLDWLSTVVARAWLPEEIIIVCERNLARRIASTFQGLSSYPDLTGSGQIGERLAQLAKAAKVELEARQADTIELDLEPRPVADTSDEVIDLTDDDTDDHNELVVMTLASNRKLRARLGSTVIRCNHGADLNPFERTTARHIKNGDVLVVPDNAYLKTARETLPIRVLAQSWVDIYHSTVRAALASLPGDTLSAKSRYVLQEVQKKGARTQTPAAVLNWLKVEEHMQVEAERRQPHAPQRRRAFDAFMNVLGVPDLLAERMWLEGIQPLRIDRRRAGHRMAQAFVSVLVDPHGTASGFDPAVRAAITALRAKALDYLDQVVDREILDVGECHD